MHTLMELLCAVALLAIGFCMYRISRMCRGNAEAGFQLVLIAGGAVMGAAGLVWGMWLTTGLVGIEQTSIRLITLGGLVGLGLLAFFFRHPSRHFLPALLTVAGLGLVARPALAGGIDFTPVVNYGIELLIGGVLAPLLGWGVHRGARALRISEDDRIRAYLDAALVNALEFGREVLLQQGKDLGQVEVRNQLVEEAARYVMPRVPDALRRFGISPDNLRGLLVARLGSVAPLPSQSTVFRAVAS